MTIHQVRKLLGVKVKDKSDTEIEKIIESAELLKDIFYSFIAEGKTDQLNIKNSD